MSIAELPAPTGNNDVAALELVSAAVVVGVDLLSVELARVAGVGPTGIPVVAVGDHHGIVMAGLRHC